MINCTCTVIQAHDEEGEIEFCSLHAAAGTMLIELKMLQVILLAGDFSTDDWRHMQKIIDKAEGK